jgi:ADP-ribose pyrophosphatase YjhB (NUDIX family)
LPGGSAEAGESFEQAAVRERREESSLEARASSQLLVGEHNGREARYFMMTNVAGTTELSGPELEDHCPDNSFEFLWASKDDFEPLGLHPEPISASRELSGQEAGDAGTATVVQVIRTGECPTSAATYGFAGLA